MAGRKFQKPQFYTPKITGRKLDIKAGLKKSAAKIMLNNRALSQFKAASSKKIGKVVVEEVKTRKFQFKVYKRCNSL